MSIITHYTRLIEQLARLVRALESPFVLALRMFVGWQFVKSGWLKFSSWDNTLYLFTEEYHVPVLPPELAAVAGTGGELIFGSLVMLGLAGRLSALGLSFVNVMAVVSYAHVLLAPGYEAALAMHELWALMLAVVVIYGPGTLSLDRAIVHSSLARSLSARPV